MATNKKASETRIAGEMIPADEAIKRFLSNAKITVDPNMKDHSHAPVFLKKAEEGAAFLKEHPLPPEFFKRAKSKR